MDVPVIVRGVVTGFLARPTAKTSIGKVFQERAARYGDKVFIKFGDEASDLPGGQRDGQPLRRGARRARRRPRRRRRRHAAQLAALGAADARRGQVRRRRRACSTTTSAARCWRTASGCSSAKAVVAETDFIEPISESDADTDGLMTLDELQQLAATAPATNPAATSAVLAKDKAFYIFTSGTTGMPKASVMTHYRWLRALAGFGGLGMRLTSDDTLYCCLPLYHNNALTVALSSVLNSGSTLALGKSFSASKFWDEVIRYDATAFVYIGEICAYLLNQPAKPTDRKHRVRVIAGNGLRPAIWDDFTKRFGIARVCEFYAASEGNTAFLNVFNVDKTTGICPSPIAFVEYDDESGEPQRDDDGRVHKVKTGEPGLLLSKVSNFQPFDGYTDKDATEKKLVRDAFKDGDVWFNTGDLMRSQGFGHAAFTDRLGDTFRWKGENVATTEVEAARVDRPAGRGVHGVRRRGGGRRRQGGHGRHPAQGRQGVRRQGAGQGRLRAPARLRGAAVRPGHRRHWRTRRRSRARRSTCARRATAATPARATKTRATSRTRSTCWPAATRATSSSTTSTPPRSSTASAPSPDAICVLNPRSSR